MYGGKEIEVIPAIDLKDGKCVRLYQGEFDRETIYSHEPLKIALSWQALGAKRLHIIDLDGSVKGEPVNTEVISKIARKLKIPVQVGGGIRTLQTMRKLLNFGVDRVIFGSAVIEDEDVLRKAVIEKQSAVVVALDVRKGFVAIHGWKQQTDIKVNNLLNKIEKIGVERVIYTNIEKDGTLLGPDFKITKEIKKITGISIIASGGISSLSHLERLKEIGVEGAIIGRALYTGDIDLKEALKITE